MATIDPRWGKSTQPMSPGVLRGAVEQAVGEAVRNLPGVPRTPVRPFFREEDFASLNRLVHREGAIDVRVISARPTAEGEVVENFVCNDVVEVRILITDRDAPNLWDKYLTLESRFHRELRSAIDTPEFALTRAEVREGSLWVWLKIKLRSVLAWLREQRSRLHWLQENKESVSFWLNTLATLLSIVSRVLQILWWLFGGEGGLPGLT